MKRRAFVILLILAMTGLGAFMQPGTLMAAPVSWVPGTGNWNSSGNWNPGIPANGDTVSIGSSQSKTTTVTVNVDTNNLDQLTLTGYASNKTVTLNNSSRILNVTYGGTSTISINNYATLTLSGTGTVQTKLLSLNSGGTFSKTGGTLKVSNTFNQNGGTSSFNSLNLDSSNVVKFALSGGTFNATSLLINSGGTYQQTGGTSTVGTLNFNGGTLDIGSSTLFVTTDYNNANFGTGNAFTPYAGVTRTTGNIAANSAVQEIIGGTNLTGGSTAPTLTLALGNIHVGSSVSSAYQIRNSGGTTAIRGAIQTSGNGNITDTRLTDSGVTAVNFGPLAAGSSTADYTVTFTGTTAGALSGQKVYILNNFSNVTDQAINITGAAYRYASANSLPTTIDLGTIRVGESFGTQGLTIQNTAANDGFSEKLNAAFGTLTGSASTNGVNISLLAPGSTSTAMVVGLGGSANTGTAGAKTGTATVAFVSDGTGTSGLGTTGLSSQVLNISGTVNNWANPIFTGDGVTGSGGAYTLDLGSVLQGSGTITASLGLLNDAVAPADWARGWFELSGDDVFTLTDFGKFADLQAGDTLSGLNVAFNTATVGDFAYLVTLNAFSGNTSSEAELKPITLSILGKVTPVPIPSAVWLLGCGLIGLVGIRRRLTA
jgi:hypothetical protein